ncbi:MAG TPA: DUF4166 domain-containing protein [Dyella sp.]|nr:DUF4166 domain-containing protein [Dyella sp.]
MDAVERWFGEGFGRLDPMLQKLHRHAGKLHGEVAIAYGRGLAGWLGRRIATRLGLPRDAMHVPMRVYIHSDNTALHWERRFGDGPVMRSVFTPSGHWPDGHWLEQTGALRLVLRVDTADGGWRWLPVASSLRGIPLPRVVVPRVEAGKCVEAGRYRFHVTVSLAPLGLLFGYAGLLSPTG